MEEIIDLIATDASSSEISDKIKDVLFTKSAEKINLMKSSVGTSMFSDTEAAQEEE